MKILFLFCMFVAVVAVIVNPYLPEEYHVANASEPTAEETEKRSKAQYESDAIQFCKDSLFERYRPTGGVSFNMGETVYLPKGYGGLIVGNGTANSGLIRFKCTFKDRILTEIQVTGR